MAVEYTLSIIKPDGVKRNITGKINNYFEMSGLEISAQKMIHLTKDQAEEFYEMHKERPFFPSMIEKMISSPVIVQVLKGENAISKNREIMGATNPEEAIPGTIRKDLSISIEENTIHGSDSLESAKREIQLFFTEGEIVS